jgi:predicted RNA-binding protein
LAQNKNIINLEIKHNPWKEEAYDLTKALWYKALNDAKQKANKVAKFLNMDIVGMKEVGSGNDNEINSENKWTGRSEAYNAKEWKHLGEIQKKEVLRVVFEID